MITQKLSKSEAGKLGSLASKKTQLDNLNKRMRQYYDNPSYCAECNSVLDYKLKNNKFCSKSCSATFNNKKRSNKKYCKCCKKECKNIYCSISCQKRYTFLDDMSSYFNGDYSFSTKRVKKFLLLDRGHICESCNNSTWLGMPINLELDHSDGNYKNNSPDNLKLLCPTCHSYTPTYKAKNKGNGREYRRKFM